MIYLDNGATSFLKPPQVIRAAAKAMACAANPGRGGYEAAMEAARTVFDCREQAAGLFSCKPEQVVLTANCTHGLNIAIESIIKPGSRVLVSGFEHNAVMRPLYARDCRVTVAGRRLFCRDALLEEFRAALRQGMDGAVFTHVSNVFGFILPVQEMAALCRAAGVPFILDAAQSAGSLPVDMGALGAEFIAMPGHKGLLGPQGTGLLLCAQPGKPLLFGGTGTLSREKTMPEDLPERLEAGTVNVPGAAGLAAGPGAFADPGEDICRWARPDHGLCPGTEGAGLSGVFRAGPGHDGVLSGQSRLRGNCGIPGEPGHCRPGGAPLRAPGPRKRGHPGSGHRPGQLRPRRMPGPDPGAAGSSGGVENAEGLGTHRKFTFPGKRAASRENFVFGSEMTLWARKKPERVPETGERSGTAGKNFMQNIYCQPGENPL